jgi:hypothetical protein
LEGREVKKVYISSRTKAGIKATKQERKSMKTIGESEGDEE